MAAMANLDGRVIAIAGAAGGLGPVVAQRLAAAGATLALTDVTPGAPGRRSRAELGLPDDRFDARVVDLLDEDAARDWAADLARALRRRRRPPPPRRRLERRRAARDHPARRLRVAPRPARPHRPAHHPRLLRRPRRHRARPLRPRLLRPRRSARTAPTPPTPPPRRRPRLDAGARRLLPQGRARRRPRTSSSSTRSSPRRCAPTSPDKPFKTFTSAEEIADAIALHLLRRRREDERQAPVAPSVSGEPSRRGLRLRQPRRRPPRGARGDRRRRTPATPPPTATTSCTAARRGALPRATSAPTPAPFLVFNGTGANVASLDALTRPYEAVICTDVAHMNVDECGAPERLAGAKLLPVAHRRRQAHAPTTSPLGAAARRRAPRRSRASSRSPRRPSSAPSTRSRRPGRSPTPPTSSTCTCTSTAPGSPTPPRRSAPPSRELTTDAGVDVVSFGGTKNGLVSATPSSSSAPSSPRTSSSPASSSASSPRRCASSRPSSRRCSPTTCGCANAAPRERDGAPARRRGRRRSTASRSPTRCEANARLRPRSAQASDRPAARPRFPATTRSTSGTRPRTWCAGCARGTRPRRTSTSSPPRSPRRRARLMSGSRERVEAPRRAGARGIAERPARAGCAGKPIRIDGQTLDPHMQVALKLEERIGGFKPAPVEEVRALRRRDARAFRGRTIEVERGRASSRSRAPPAPIGARLYAPAGISARRR